TWNMRYWQRAPDSENAWRYLQDDRRPDFALLQETVPPTGLDPAQLVYRKRGIGGTRRWGSAVVSFGVPIQGGSVARSVYGKRDVSILETHPGIVAVAETTIAGELYAFVSVYGLIDNRYADTTMHRIISDLTPLLDSARFTKRVILGGDFNVCARWSGGRAY